MPRLVPGSTRIILRANCSRRKPQIFLGLHIQAVLKARINKTDRKGRLVVEGPDVEVLHSVALNRGLRFQPWSDQARGRRARELITKADLDRLQG